AGILAVIMITLGGIQYMTTDAISGKTEGKAVITRALLGLMLALASWLILYTINPNILNFSLNPQAPPQQSSGGYISSICATTQEECEQYYNATLESDCVPPPTTCSESSEGNWCIAYGFCPP